MVFLKDKKGYLQKDNVQHLHEILDVKTQRHQTPVLQECNIYLHYPHQVCSVKQKQKKIPTQIRVELGIQSELVSSNLFIDWTHL